MSTALNKLKKLEKRAWSDWWQSIRYAAEARNAYITADASDRREKKAIMTMAFAAADSKYQQHITLVSALDEVEAMTLNGNRHP